VTRRYHISLQLFSRDFPEIMKKRICKYQEIPSSSLLLNYFNIFHRHFCTRMLLEMVLKFSAFLASYEHRTCAQKFFRYIAGKFRWPGILSRNLRPTWQKLFCSRYEFSLRHPVLVEEINIMACNSVFGCHLPGLRELCLLMSIKTQLSLLPVSRRIIFYVRQFFKIRYFLN
jgi:hypothetical protein